jgi:DNA-binding NarL/FixJ family response regulator
MIKILLVDDHTIVRRGLKQILAGTPDMVVLDEASNAREALSKTSQNTYDVILLDITMPDIDGLQFLDRIKKENPDQSVLILSMHPEEEFAVESFKKGAAGYITKESAPEELIVALRKVHSGGKYVSPKFAERLASELKIGMELSLHEQLSQRELEVMKMIASGKKLQEMAGHLSLSAKTISSYRASLMKKMKMKNNAEITAYAVKNNLI